MSFKSKESLGGVLRLAGNISPSIPTPKQNIGKVCAVVLDENTPSPALFNKAGGWSGIGSVYYLDFNAGKNVNINTVNLNDCKIAKPIHDNHQNYPLKGELIHLVGAPTPTSQTSNTSNQKYYTGTVNVWNDNQQNSLTDDSLGNTFNETSDIRKLRSFEGDRIYQGRKGNGIRFGSTVKARSNINEWSSIGNDGDPITIMVNGYVTTDTGSLAPNIEEINKEKSSIYLTSTQKLPLEPGSSFFNPRVNTIRPNNYISSQLILNSDRVTLNAKKDEVLLFAKTNIELTSDNIININAKKTAHINSPSIALGTKDNGDYPTEPVLLGDKTYDLFLELFGALTNLAGSLVEASTQDGPIVAVSSGGTQLFEDIDNLLNKLDTITSEKVYTA
jgi:hypothetical protein